MASFFKSLGKKVSGGLSLAADYVGDSATKALTSKYPDIDEVFDTLNEMKARYRETTGAEGGEDEVDGDGDDKWRPALLTLALLYKLQRIQDSHADSWYNRGDIFVSDDAEEERLLHTFGYYWHMTARVSEALRTIDNKGAGKQYGGDGQLLDSEDIFLQVVDSTGVPREDVAFAHATDSLHVDEHCPDFSMVVLHEIRQVLIVICGTRMIPAPKMKDVFMDLYADSAPFLHGKAHMGMAIGARNILAKIGDELRAGLAEGGRAGGYNVMVTGYSLGAGICQLLALDLVEGESAGLLPAGTEVRCVSFGAPPVFRSAGEESGDYRCPNLFSVVYNNDGLASASISTVTKLFMQMREVNRLKMRRRDMLQ